MQQIRRSRVGDDEGHDGVRDRVARIAIAFVAGSG